MKIKKLIIENLAKKHRKAAVALLVLILVFAGFSFAWFVSSSRTPLGETQAGRIMLIDRTDYGPGEVGGHPDFIQRVLPGETANFPPVTLEVNNTREALAKIDNKTDGYLRLTETLNNVLNKRISGQYVYNLMGTNTTKPDLKKMLETYFGWIGYVPTQQVLDVLDMIYGRIETVGDLDFMVLNYYYSASDSMRVTTNTQFIHVDKELCDAIAELPATLGRDLAQLMFAKVYPTPGTNMSVLRDMDVITQALIAPKMYAIDNNRQIVPYGTVNGLTYFYDNIQKMKRDVMVNTENTLNIRTKTNNGADALPNFIGASGARYAFLEVPTKYASRSAKSYGKNSSDLDFVDDMFNIPVKLKVPEELGTQAAAIADYNKSITADGWFNHFRYFEYFYNNTPNCTILHEQHCVLTFAIDAIELQGTEMAVMDVFHEDNLDVGDLYDGTKFIKVQPAETAASGNAGSIIKAFDGLLTNY